MVIKIYQEKKWLAQKSINKMKKNQPSLLLLFPVPRGPSPLPPNHRPRPLPLNKQPLRGLKCDHTEEEKNIIEHKLLSGKYPNIATMATDINGRGGPLQGCGGGDLSKYDENHVGRVQPLIFFD